VPRRVVVVHFNPPNLDKRLAWLAEHDVEPLMPKGPADLKPLRQRPPDAFLVDLDRRPSEGRSIAVQLRRYASTRAVPLVFAGGEEDQSRECGTCCPTRRTSRGRACSAG
jgi:hypothetical protein